MADLVKVRWSISGTYQADPDAYQGATDELELLDLIHQEIVDDPMEFIAFNATDGLQVEVSR